MIEAIGQKQTILVVDDAVENLQVLVSLLGDEYNVKIAKNGKRALELMAIKPYPDLVLLDIMMPEMDGYETCRRIKANPETAHIPVIFLTALNDVTDEKKGFASGGSDFIIKPFNPDLVKTRVRTHLELMLTQRKLSDLLRVLLPDKVISDLTLYGKHTPVLHQNVSILFSDFVGFTQITTKLSPENLILELSEIFSAFDDIIINAGAVRIKTIGDAYMAVCGLNNTPENHADVLLQCGLDFLKYLNNRNKHSHQEWICRIGMHSGSVIAGIVGQTRFVYDVLGDSVNIASRVEGAGTPMAVAITDETRLLLKNNFNISDGKQAFLRGRGEVSLYTVSTD